MKNKNLIQRLAQSFKTAQKGLAGVSAEQKKKLEDGWDIEHAYYSSALEGSKLDRKEFESLAKKV